MLRPQVDIARDEMLEHTAHNGLCKCGHRLKRDDKYHLAEHVATEVVIALERYALGNPEESAQKVKPRAFMVNGIAFLTSIVLSSHPLERKSMTGSRINTHAVEVKTIGGGSTELLLTESEMTGFISAMAGGE